MKKNIGAYYKQLPYIVPPKEKECDYSVTIPQFLDSFQFECRLPLRLAVQSSHGVFFKIIDVTVLLTDINDNEPVFSPSVTELSVMENAIVGDLYSLPNAEDADTGANNSVQSYALLTRDVPFRLEMQGSSLLDRGPRLRLATSLDREAVAAYRLIVVAFDGGQPVRSGTLTVNVEVILTFLIFKYIY